MGIRKFLRCPPLPQLSLGNLRNGLTRTRLCVMLKRFLGELVLPGTNLTVRGKKLLSESLQVCEAILTSKCRSLFTYQANSYESPGKCRQLTDFQQGTCRHRTFDSTQRAILPRSSARIPKLQRKSHSPMWNLLPDHVQLGHSKVFPKFFFLPCRARHDSSDGRS